MVSLLTAQQSAIAELQARVAQLEALLNQRGSPPSGAPPPAGVARAVPIFVKPNRERKENLPKKRRKQSFARRREAPTETIQHFPDHCSKCQRKLAGGWLHSSRQVIELPEAPIRIIEHQFMACKCGVCGNREIAHPDLSDTVVGQSRIGIRLMSFIAHLDTVCRMTVRSIQQLLRSVFNVHLSIGGITQILHRTAQRGLAAYEMLLEEVRSSKVVHADETGARENGVNGYEWSFSTPQVRYYIRSPSRGGAVAREVLGEAFKQVLVTDFYSGYHWYEGMHQYCWVHLWRDLRKLKEEHPANPSVCAWVDALWNLYQEAKDFQSESVFARQKQRRIFQARIIQLIRPYEQSSVPQHTLAKRIRKHILGLFTFVEHPDVPSENNAAERAIRPFVILRKVSGGTRSKQGSDTQAILMSLFGTWILRHQNTMDECAKMLAGKPHSIMTTAATK